MLERITIGRFYQVKSDIHTLNPIVKIICLIIFVISFLLSNDIYYISILFIFEWIMFLVTNVPFKVVLKNIFSLKYLFVFIILIQIFTNSNYLITVILLLKIIGIVLYSNIFILTTTPNEILKGLNQLLKPLKYIGIKTQNISLIISLAIRFIPITIEEANRIMTSLRVRGLANDSGISEKIMGLKSLIIPLYLSSFRKADALADMMEIRLYNIDNQKKYQKVKWNYLEVLLLIIHVILFIVVLKEVVL